MFVNLGSRYSTISPVFAFSRNTRSLNSPPDHASPFLSAVTSEHGEINVVLRVRNDVVDIRPRDAERLKHFELAGFFVEAQHCVRTGVLQPHLAVDFMMFGTDLIDLYVIAVQLRRKAPRL